MAGLMATRLGSEGAPRRFKVQVLATKVLVGPPHHGSRRVNGVSAKGFCLEARANNLRWSVRLLCRYLNFGSRERRHVRISGNEPADSPK